MEQQTNKILVQFEGAIRGGETVVPILGHLLELLGGRAMGLWRRENNNLLQIGFHAVAEMDAEVRKQFSEFTQEVPLENTGLGIVKAVIEKKPATGTLQGEKSGLEGSSEWLRKFGAQQSYAVPIFEGDQVVGVLAISTNCIHQVGDTEWEVLTNIAAGIGQKKLLGML